MTTPKSRDHWYLNQELVEGLRDALAHPAFQTARAFLLQQESAARVLSGSLSQKPDVLLARNLCYLDGFQSAFDQLDALTRHPAPRDGSAPEGPWDYIKAPRASGLPNPESLSLEEPQA